MSVETLWTPTAAPHPTARTPYAAEKAAAQATKERALALKADEVRRDILTAAGAMADPYTLKALIEETRQKPAEVKRALDALVADKVLVKVKGGWR